MVQVQLPRYLFILLMVFCSFTLAAQSTWSVSPIFGVHQPPLADLNEGEFLAPLQLKAIDSQTLDNLGNTTTTRYANPLSKLKPGGEAGAEFFWRMDNKNGFIFGLSIWQSVSVASNDGLWGIKQNSFSPAQHVVANERRADLSYTQFYVGWRRYLIKTDKRFAVYSTVSLHELFDIDYQDRFVFDIGPDENGQVTDLTGNKRILIYRAQATGGINLGLGLGGEYFVEPWLSLGVQGNFYITLGELSFSDFRVDHDLLAADGFDPAPFEGPFTSSNGSINYQISADTQPVPLLLDLGGWRVLLRMNFYF